MNDQIDKLLDKDDWRLLSAELRKAITNLADRVP